MGKDAGHAVLTPHGPAPFQRGCSKARSVTSALVYIEFRFREPISLKDIAEASHVSRFHFARTFRSQTGMSPMQYVRWRRVLEAKRLLRTGRVPLATMATDLGYFDHSHFSRAFRAATGVSPHQYLATVKGSCNVRP